MKNFLLQFKNRIARSENPEEKRRSKADLLKSIVTLVLSAALLLFGTIAWFSHGKIPNAVDLKIDDPTAVILIEKYDSSDSSYEILYNELIDELEEGAFYIDIPDMTFYKWEGSVVSSITENLYYRITVTSRFETLHFSSDPALYITPVFSAESEQNLLESIQILKAEYIVFDFFENEFDESFFPEDGFEEMPTKSEPPSFPVTRRVVSSDGKERFQSVVYLRISPDTKAIESIIDDLEYSLVPHEAMNSFMLSFGFKSTPFYTPAEESSAAEESSGEETSAEPEEESSSGE